MLSSSFSSKHFSYFCLVHYVLPGPCAIKNQPTNHFKLLSLTKASCLQGNGLTGRDIAWVWNSSGKKSFCVNYWWPFKFESVSLTYVFNCCFLMLFILFFIAFRWQYVQISLTLVVSNFCIFWYLKKSLFWSNPLLLLYKYSDWPTKLLTCM